MTMMFVGCLLTAVLTESECCRGYCLGPSHVSFNGMELSIVALHTYFFFLLLHERWVYIIQCVNIIVLILFILEFYSQSFMFLCTMSL